MEKETPAIMTEKQNGQSYMSWYSQQMQGFRKMYKIFSSFPRQRYSLNEECRTAELKLFHKKTSASAIKEISLKIDYDIKCLVEVKVVKRIRFQ